MNDRLLELAGVPRAATRATKKQKRERRKEAKGKRGKEESGERESWKGQVGKEGKLEGSNTPMGQRPGEFVTILLIYICPLIFI